ncbi:MAG: hypothetical protein Q4G09_04040 [Clostridia bacterium]|nr:hypothetical protein [Clostridia bacterium]
MNKKKMLKLVLLVILILIAIFLGFTIRKMIIIKNLNQKVAKYVNDDNHYEKIINYSGSTTTTTDYYCKGNQSVLFLNATTATGEERKLTNYYKEEKVNTYIESSEDKIALLDSNALPSKVTIVDIYCGDNLWDLFKIAMSTSIKNAEYNGKECYILSLGNTEESYIEKATGLRLKAKDGSTTDGNGNTIPTIVEYHYEFGNVNEDIFIEPDISQFKKIDNI